MNVGEAELVAPLRISARDLATAVGAVLPPSRWLQVEQPRIGLFADATEDRQWIHVDAERAKSGPYGVTVAHGFLTLSLIAPMLRDMLRVEDVAGAFNYGVERLRFPAAVRCGDQIRASGFLAEAVEKAAGMQVRLRLTIEIEGQKKPACVFDLIILYTFAPE